MPEVTHDNTVRVFSEHFFAHLEFNDLFVCTSKAVAEDLREIGQNKSISLSALENLQLGEFATIPDTTLHDWPSPSNVNQFLLCVVTVEARKNHQTVLAAFDHLSAEFPDLCLVLVGRLSWLAEDVARRIRTHELHERRLFWLENIDDKVLAQLYRRATLCVIVSHYEGFGLPLTEALHHGCVTISSSAGLLPESGGEYADYVDPLDTRGLVTRIEKYLANPDLLKAGRQKVLQRPSRSWQQVATDLVSILNRRFE